MKEKTVMMILMETSDSTGGTFYLDILYPTNSYFLKSQTFTFSYHMLFTFLHIDHLSCKKL